MCFDSTTLNVIIFKYAYFRIILIYSKSFLVDVILGKNLPTSDSIVIGLIESLRVIAVTK